MAEVIGRLDIDICALDAFDNVRRPPFTSPFGVALSYRSVVEVDVDFLVTDACDLEWHLVSAENGGLGE